MADPRSRRSRHYDLREPVLNDQIDELIEHAQQLFGESSSTEPVRQIIVSALRLMRDDTSQGDLRLVNDALKELRHAFRVFRPYAKLRKVAVFGSARVDPGGPTWQQAHRFAEQIVQQGWMVITGAGGGIMGAAQGGAGREASFGVNIRLPFEQVANEVIAGDAKLINFRYFFTRKVTFVKEAHAIALFPGGFGTHDEGFEALTLIQTGKSEILPVVFVDAAGGSYWADWRHYLDTHLRAAGLIGEDDFNLFKITDDVDVAVQEILNFYSNYHSSRYVGDLLVLRTHRAPNPEQLEKLNDEFSDILTGGKIEVSAALPSERGEVADTPRVVLRFNRRSVGRLRRLIDMLNTFVGERAATGVPASPHEIVARELTPEAEHEEDSEE